MLRYYYRWLSSFIFHTAKAGAPLTKQSRMKKITKIIVSKANLPYIICNHVVGKSHSPRHRKIVGFIMCYTGVSIVHLTAHIAIFEYFGEGFGNGVFAIGFIPFVESIGADAV